MTAYFYAHLLYRLITDGDDFLDVTFKSLRKDGFVDENDEWIYPEELS